MKTGNLTALIARSADFYGARARTGIPNALVFRQIGQGARKSELACQRFCEALVHLHVGRRAESGSAGGERKAPGNQTWHVPTAPDPPTGKQFIELIAKEFGTQPKYRVLIRPMLRVAGVVRYDRPRIVRDALPVRIRLHLRFNKIHDGVPLSADFLRRKASAEQPKPTDNRRSLHDHEGKLRQKVN